MLAFFAGASPAAPLLRRSNNLESGGVKCEFVDGDGTGTNAQETFVGDMPHEQCAAAVRAMNRNANGATVTKEGRVAGGHPGCWAEEGVTGTTNPSGSYMTCLFDVAADDLAAGKTTELKESVTEQQAAQQAAQQQAGSIPQVASKDMEAQHQRAEAARAARDKRDALQKAKEKAESVASDAKARAESMRAKVAASQQEQAEELAAFEIPVLGTPEPFKLLPKGNTMSLVTSHFALPMAPKGNATTGLTMEYVYSLTKYKGFKNGLPMARHAASKHNAAKSVQLMSHEDLPSHTEYEHAMRLVQGTKHYKTAAKLAKKAKARKLKKATSLAAAAAPGYINHPVMFKEVMDAQTIFMDAALHYAMIEASIVTNLLNYPTLTEVYVVYDSGLADNDCTHLVKRILNMTLAVLQETDPSYDSLDGRAASLKCFDRGDKGQPSYYEMFDYASNTLELENEVVVMGNGDGATDETLSQLSAVQRGVVVMLSVTGFKDKSILTEWQENSLVRQPHAQTIFEAIVGDLDDVCDPPPKSRCLMDWDQRREQAFETFDEGHVGEWHYFRWPEQLLSWDGYVFRRPLPPLSQKVLHPQIHMNQPGAENRAGMALYLALGKDSLIYNNTLPNACGHVNWYHYHCTSAPVEYAATDNIAITTHEWRSMFGNASIPPKTALVKGLTLAIGVQEVDLDLVVRDLLVAYTTGCSDIAACLHGGKPTHHALPDIIDFLGYDPTCTHPECLELYPDMPGADANVNKSLGEAPPKLADKEESVPGVGEDPKMMAMNGAAKKNSCAAKLGDKKLVSEGACGPRKEGAEQMCTMCCSAEGFCGSDASSCGEGSLAEYSLKGEACWPALKYEKVQANARCKNEVFLAECKTCKNELKVDWGFEPAHGSLYQDHLPSSDLLYASDKIEECMHRCQHAYGSADEPIKAFSLDSHARCACAADTCDERVEVPLPSKGNANMDMTASYLVAGKHAATKSAVALLDTAQQAEQQQAAAARELPKPTAGSISEFYESVAREEKEKKAQRTIDEMGIDADDFKYMARLQGPALQRLSLVASRDAAKLDANIAPYSGCLTQLQECIKEGSDADLCKQKLDTCVQKQSGVATAAPKPAKAVEQAKPALAATKEVTVENLEASKAAVVAGCATKRDTCLDKGFTQHTCERKRKICVLDPSRAESMTAKTPTQGGGEGLLVVHAGPQFADARLIDNVLHSNAVGLLEEKNVLYPLSHDAWGMAHHFWVAQACQCNPFVVVQHIYYANTFHAPLEYPMEMEMSTTLLQTQLRHPPQGRDRKATDRKNVHLAGSNAQLQLLAKQAKAAVQHGDVGAKKTFSNTLASLYAKHTSKVLDDIEDDIEAAGSAEFAGNTHVYNGNLPSDDIEAGGPEGSVQSYVSNDEKTTQNIGAISASDDEPAQQQQQEEEGPQPISPPLDGVNESLAVEDVPIAIANPNAQPLPGVSPTAGAMKTNPGLPGSPLGYIMYGDEYIYHDPDLLKVEYPAIRYRNADEEREYQWDLVDEDDPNGIGKIESKELTEAVFDSLAAHKRTKLISSFTLEHQPLEALLEFKKMADMYSSNQRIVCFYRDQKNFLLDRYRNQDLFKVTLDKLGVFDYSVQPFDELIIDSQNSTSKGMEGLTVEGVVQTGHIETILTRVYLNTTQSWDRMISVFGRHNFRLIEYAAVKIPGSNHGFDVTNALLEVATAPNDLLTPENPTITTNYSKLESSEMFRPYAPPCLDALYECYEKMGMEEAEFDACNAEFASCIEAEYPGWVDPSPSPDASPSPTAEGDDAEPPIRKCIDNKEACKAEAGSDDDAMHACNNKLATCVKNNVIMGGPLPSPAPDSNCDQHQTKCLDSGYNSEDLCNAKLATCVYREERKKNPHQRAVRLSSLQEIEAATMEAMASPEPAAAPGSPLDPLVDDPTVPEPKNTDDAFPQLPKDVRGSAWTPEYISDREVAFRQMWHEFRGYAYTRTNCTVMWPWEPRKTLFSSILPMATWDLPMRCYDVTTLDAEALALDEKVRMEYGDVLLYADQKATEKAIKASDAPFCELDRAAVRNNTAHWAPLFTQMLMSLPYGACLEVKETLEFLPPPMYVTAPPSPPCNEEIPVTYLTPEDWVGLPPPLPPPPPSPPPLNEAFTEVLTTAAKATRSFSCRSRMEDKPMSIDGVPTQYVHVPKAAGSSIQMLLLYYVAIPQDVFFVVGEVTDYPESPPGTIFVGHTPIANDPTSKIQAKRDFVARNPFYMSTFRDPLDRLISLYDYRALFNMSMCTGDLDEDGYYPRIGFLDIWFPGPSLTQCMMIEQFKKDERDAIASGVPETGLMDHFFKKRHPHVISMVTETQYNWFIPRDDPGHTYPTTSDAALACSMANVLRTDVLINADRFDETVLANLQYHAPYLGVDPNGQSGSDIMEAMSSNLHGSRAPQVVSPEVRLAIKRLPSAILDQRFYEFAEKLAVAREANMFACLNSNFTSPDCKDTCDDVLTEDEYLMIANSKCGEQAQPVMRAAYASGMLSTAPGKTHHVFEPSRLQEKPCKNTTVDVAAINAKVAEEKATAAANAEANATAAKTKADASIEAKAEAQKQQAIAQIEDQSEAAKATAEAAIEAAKAKQIAEANNAANAMGQAAKEGTGPCSNGTHYPGPVIPHIDNGVPSGPTGVPPV